MATGSNVSKANAYAVIRPQDLSVSKASVYAVLNSLVSRVSQVSITVPVEVDDANSVSQVASSPVIESTADVKVSQVTLALVIPSTYYPKDEWSQPYPCTIWVNRVPFGYICLNKEPILTCVNKAEYDVASVIRADDPDTTPCFTKDEYDLVDLTRDCADE